MNWDGEIVFGAAWAAYRGPVAENALHAHAALQLVFGIGADVTLHTDAAEKLRSRGFLIRPAAAHAIVSKASVGLIYIEVQSPLAFRLKDFMDANAIAPAPAKLLNLLDSGAEPRAWLDALEAALPTVRRLLDPRIGDVLGQLDREPRLSIADAAHRAGISGSRLRDLAQQELGISLSTWLVWRKLERAAKTLASGASLAEAAVAGGFADQAHFARTMRRMFGVTPRMARAALG